MSKLMSIAEMCRLKEEFEQITYSFNMNGVGKSDINTLEWFVENGHRSNSLRSGYERAKEIAFILTEEFYGAKETGAWVST